jgi:hypothetical protein
MKYVVMQVTSKDGQTMRIPFIFPEIVVHQLAAAVFVPLLQEHFKNSEVKPLSAGFLSCMDIEPECHGESESLGLESLGELDDELIAGCDYGSMHA